MVVESDDERRRRLERNNLRDLREFIGDELLAGEAERIVASVLPAAPDGFDSLVRRNAEADLEPIIPPGRWDVAKVDADVVDMTAEWIEKHVVLGDGKPALIEDWQRDYLRRVFDDRPVGVLHLDARRGGRRERRERSLLEVAVDVVRPMSAAEVDAALEGRGRSSTSGICVGRVVIHA